MTSWDSYKYYDSCELIDHFSYGHSWCRHFIIQILHLFNNSISNLCKIYFRVVLFSKIKPFLLTTSKTSSSYIRNIQEDKSLGGPKTGLQNYCLKSRLCDASICRKIHNNRQFKEISIKKPKRQLWKKWQIFLKRTLKTRPIWWEVHNEAAYTRKYNINEINIK